MTVAAEDLGPIALGEAIGLALGLREVIELGEGVVLLHEALAEPKQLTGKPLPRPFVDLQGEWRPGLQTDVDEAQLRIEEIIVEHSLLTQPGNESRPPLAGNEGKRLAGFLGAQDTDQSRLDALLADQLLGPLLLLERTGAIKVGATCLTCQSLSV